MSCLYLTEQGLSIQKKQRRLLIKKEGKVIREIPIFQIERILIFGNIQITTQTIAFLLEEGISCNFFSSNGKFRGTLTPVQSGNVLLRIAQYERYLDKTFRINTSKSIINSKINNEIEFLKKYPRIISDDRSKKIIYLMKDILKDVENKDSILSIMGCEGKATSLYFKILSQIFKGDFNFNKRTHHPPKDPINSLLSFGYSLLMSEIFSLLSGLGFDPYVGYLHDISYLRPSLALDIMEEYRAPVIDSLIVKIINKKIIKIDDFIENEGAFYLKDEPKKVFFLQYEKVIKNYKEIIKTQLNKLKESIIKGDRYKPYFLK